MLLYHYLILYYYTIIIKYHHYYYSTFNISYDILMKDPMKLGESLCFIPSPSHEITRHPAGCKLGQKTRCPSLLLVRCRVLGDRIPIQKQLGLMDDSQNMVIIIWLVVEPYPCEKSWSERQLGL